MFLGYLLGQLSFSLVLAYIKGNMNSMYIQQCIYSCKKSLNYGSSMIRIFWKEKSYRNLILINIILML